MLTLHQDLLYYGNLEKRRDGAVRGGWAMRTFVLTKMGLYYYRRLTEWDILGEERGKLFLKDIVSVKAIAQAEIHPSAVEPGMECYFLEIITTLRSIVMRVPVAHKAVCEQWCRVIDEQLHQPPEQQVSADGTVISSTLSVPEDQIPRVLFITGVHSTNCLSPSSRNPEIPDEWVIHDSIVPWGQTIDLGILPQGGACILTLEDSSSARIGTQALMGSWDAGEPRWVEICSSNLIAEIKVSVTCHVTRKSANTPDSPPTDRPAPPTHLTTVQMIETCASGLFLLLCFLIHLFYGVQQFHWSHRLCITVGVGLAFTSIFYGFLHPRTNPLPTPKTSTTEAIFPELQFSLTLHGCRISQPDGTTYYHPA